MTDPCLAPTIHTHPCRYCGRPASHRDSRCPNPYKTGPQWYCARCADEVAEDVANIALSGGE